MQLVAEPLATVVSSGPAPVRLPEEVQGDDREELRQALFEDPPPLGAIPGLPQAKRAVHVPVT
jgi:hypothetical protein